MASLSPRHARFVEEYLVDLNATQAVLRAGYSETGASTTGVRLLANPRIAAAIAHAMAERSRRTQVTQDRVVEELARLAFADVRDAATWTDETMYLRPSADLDDITSAAIKEVRVVRTITRIKRKGGDEDEIERVEQRVQMHDKKGALDSLAKHLGMFPSTAGPAVVVNNDNRRVTLAEGATLDDLRSLRDQYDRLLIEGPAD